MIDDKKIEAAKEEIYEDRFLLNGEEIVFNNDEKEEMFYEGDIKEAIGLGAKWAINEFLDDLNKLIHPASEVPRNDNGKILAFSKVNSNKKLYDMNAMLNETACDTYQEMWEDYIKALPVKIGDKIMDEDGRVGQLSRIVPYRSPSERFMCATLSLTLFFHMEKKDGTYDNREVYVHGFPIKL